MSNSSLEQLIPKDESAREENRYLASLIAGRLASLGYVSAAFPRHGKQLVYQAFVSEEEDEKLSWLEEAGLDRLLADQIDTGDLCYFSLDFSHERDQSLAITPVFGPDGRLMQNLSRIDRDRYLTISNHWFFGKESGVGIVLIATQELNHEAMCDMIGEQAVEQIIREPSTVHSVGYAVRLADDEDRLRIERYLHSVEAQSPISWR